MSNLTVQHTTAPPISRVCTPALRSDWLGNNASFKSNSFQNGPLYCSCSSVRHSTRTGNGLNIHMAVVDERLVSNAALGKRFGTLAYDLVQGALVRWSSLMDKSVPEPPTAVLIHGILGCRKNWGSFTRRLAKSFPMWQFLLIDLRCHGDSASMKKRSPHTVAAAALDVLKLVSQLRITPRVLVGHSFGGKVVLSMVEQAAKPLARPVKVWVLDATPGKLRPGRHGEDHPAELISYLRRMPEKIPSKQYVLDSLVQEGFSMDVAQHHLILCHAIMEMYDEPVSQIDQVHEFLYKTLSKWVLTNLRRCESPGVGSSFSWVFDLEGISELYHSFEETNLWKIVEDVPRGVHVNFLKAERSLHRWALEDIQRIHAAEEIAVDEGAGVQMHVLEDAGHWVHADNPDGLFKILYPTFEQFRA